MPALTLDQIQIILQWVEPYVRLERERLALVDRLFAGQKSRPDIDYSGTASVFSARLIDALSGWELEGKPALISLLKALTLMVSDERVAQIDGLVRHLSAPIPALPPSPQLPDDPFIFISYSRADADFRQRLIEGLSKYAVTIWIDILGLPPGTPDWEAAIRAALEKTRALVLVATPDSRQASVVRDELRLARSAGKPIIPLWVRGDVWEDCVPLGMGGMQYIDLRTSIDEHSAWRSAMLALAPHLIPSTSKAALERLRAKGDLHTALALLEKLEYSDNETVRAAAAVLKQEIQSQIDRQDQIGNSQRDLTEIRSLIRKFRSNYPTIPLPRDLCSGMGDEALPPPFEWCAIPAGEVVLEDGIRRVAVDAFDLAKYPITNAQFLAFIDDGGYENERWWEFSSSAWAFWEQNRKQPQKTGYEGADLPRTNVSWYEAAAFTHWLTERLNSAIRLPTEAQWQRAAAGDDERRYPWGNDYDSKRCNTSESGNLRPTSASTYDFPSDHPHCGRSPFGAVDMAGNVLEWCSNDYDAPYATSLDGAQRRVLRGGSWFNNAGYARTAFRYFALPSNRNLDIGFRVSRLAVGG